MTMTDDATTVVRWWRNGDHPADNCGELLDDPMHPGDAAHQYHRIEGAVVRFFRHPDVPGDQTHDRCGRTWHDHGWIDSGGDGQIVCPGDKLTTAPDGRVTVEGDLSIAERLIGEAAVLLTAAHTDVDFEAELPDDVNAFLDRAHGALPATGLTVEADPPTTITLGLLSPAVQGFVTFGDGDAHSGSMFLTLPVAAYLALGSPTTLRVEAG